MKTPVRIAPSLLSADFARLGDEVRAVIEAGADLVHFDVMDNHYVPNLTVGPLVCAAVKPHASVPLDVHLMVKPVDRIVPDFARAGASFISFHPEASEHIDRTIGLIREHGCRPGLAFNPATPLNWLTYAIDRLDLVLIMSVNPGFGGQPFIPHSIEKVRRVRALLTRAGSSAPIEIDGGIDESNAAAVVAAGVSILVAGQAIFGTGDPESATRALRAAAVGSAASSRA